MNMKTILLVIALAARAEAPKAGFEPAAAASAAVAAVPVLTAAERIPAATAADGFLPEAFAVPAATAAVQNLAEVPGVRAVDPGRVNVFPSPADATGCSLSALLRTRFLSGPWSAARRLEAARLRGDREEVRRMESALDTLVDEATALE